MQLTDYLLVKPKFLADYEKRLKSVDSEKASKIELRSLEDQLDKMYSITDQGEAAITISGPLSEEGPDEFDIVFGYGGTSYMNIRHAIEKARVETTGNIYLNINSPGGTLTGLDDTFEAIREAAKERTVIAVNYGLVASAALWLASGATKLIAKNPTSMTGSIGVVVTATDFSGYYAKYGIDVVTLTNTASPDKRPDIKTEDGQNVIITELNQLYSVFENRVLNLGISVESIRSLKGAVVAAEKAIEIGLVAGYKAEGDTSTGDNDQGIDIEGDREAGQEDEQKEELKIMNLAELKKEHPELYAEVLDLGKVEGTKAEKERALTYVEAMQKLPSCEAIYMKALKDDKGINDVSVQAEIMSHFEAKKETATASNESPEDVIPAKKEVEKADVSSEGESLEDMQALIKNNL